MFRLALTLGKSLGEVGSWPVRELREWAAFERIHPFPATRSDVQAAIIAQTAAGILGKPPKLSAFIPDYTKDALVDDGIVAAQRHEDYLLHGLNRKPPDSG